ncbi:MAG: oligosaccharide flippase family protein [Ignavibacteriaceae bacterium]
MLDKLKQLTRETAIYGISTMIGRFLSFLLVPFYTNIFYPEDYGIITNLYAFIALFNIIYLYGMDSAYIRFATEKEVGEEADNFSTPYLTILFTSLVFSLLLITFRETFGNLLGLPQQMHYLLLITSSILFTDSLSAIPFIRLRLEHKAKKFAVFKLINIGITIILNIILIIYLRLGIKAVFISNLAASVLTLILLLPDIRTTMVFRIRKKILKRFLKFGIPYLPAGIAGIIIQVIDRPIMEHLTDLKTLGIYQANYKLGIFMMLFVNMFQYAWQPFFMQESKEKNAKEVFSKVFSYFTIIAGFILVILSLFINDIIHFNIGGYTLIGRQYWEGLYIVPVVLLAYIFNGFYVIFTAGVFIKEKSIYLPVVTGLGALVNIIANFILIPVIGIMGAALATLLSYFCMAAGLYIVNQKVYRIKFEFRKVFSVFLLITLSAVIYYYLLFNGYLNFSLKIVLFLFYSVSVFVFVFEKREVNFLLEKLKKRKDKF